MVELWFVSTLTEDDFMFSVPGKSGPLWPSPLITVCSNLCEVEKDTGLSLLGVTPFRSTTLFVGYNYMQLSN